MTVISNTCKHCGTMKWTKKIPTEVGWYWKRNPSDKYDKPECIYVRDYAGELAIGNSYLRGWDGLKCYEWAGPIPMPYMIEGSMNENKY